MTTITEEAGTAHELVGIQPDNLLAFLALLGLMRALETSQPTWQPRISWQAAPPVALLHLALPVKQDEIVKVADAGIRRLGGAYAFDRKNITHSREEFRDYATRAVGEQALLVSALASDGALKRNDDAVEATPLCAMFGQGHQDFLSRLAAMATRDDPQNADDLTRALFKPWRYDDEAESFRWDPIEDRRYALQFGDPSEGKNKIGTVRGANRLAAIGFGALTSAPTVSGLATLGVAGRRSERDVSWPIPRYPTSLVGYLALLAHPWLGRPEQAPALAAYGVRAVARSRRFQVGKFFNFERARIQYLEPT